MPQRIQLRRTRGWRKPEGAIVVARPSKWGNPFKLGGPSGLARVPAVNYPDRAWEYEGRCTAAGAYHPYVSDEVVGHPLAIPTPQLSIKAYVPCHVRDMTAAESVACYRAYVTGGGWPIDWKPRPGFTLEDIRRDLGGHDLACWCPLSAPCHADVLLELANMPDTATATVEATLRRFLDGDPTDASWVRLRRILIPAVASTIVANLSSIEADDG